MPVDDHVGEGVGTGNTATHRCACALCVHMGGRLTAERNTGPIVAISVPVQVEEQSSVFFVGSFEVAAVWVIESFGSFFGNLDTCVVQTKCSCGG